MTSDDVIARFLNGDYKTQHVGNRIWVWVNKATGKTIITGDEGNSWCIKLTEASSREKALKQLKVKMEKGTVFTAASLKILESEGVDCIGVCSKCNDENREETDTELKLEHILNIK